MRPLPLILGYLFVTTLPLALSWLGERPPRSAWDELATGAGMLAFAVILVEFVLSGRFRAVSSGIGMDVTMRLHQLLARSALALALVHPFLYRAPSGWPLPWDPTRQLTLTGEFGSLASGIVAWLLLGALVLLAIGRDRLVSTYERWRLGHGLGALAVAGLVLHHALAAGRYSQDPLLAWTWTALFAVAALTLGWVYLVSPTLQRRRPWSVRSVRPVALRTWELTLAPEGHDGLRYDAGQFVWLNVGSSPYALRENPFSISSAPAGGPELQFIIKELGDFTATVGRIPPGARAYVDGPHGNLSIADRPEPGIALIAGGVGVAPLLGILRELRARRDTRPTALVYGNRVAEQIVDREALEELARAHGTRLIHMLSEPPAGWEGRIGMVDAAAVREIFAAPEMQAWLYILCGPPAMMQAVEDALIGLGVPARQILSERFRYD